MMLSYKNLIYTDSWSLIKKLEWIFHFVFPDIVSKMYAYITHVHLHQLSLHSFEQGYSYSENCSPPVHQKHIKNRR